MELAGRAVERAVDAARRGDDAWQGPWWLLHGLAAIGSYGLGGFAWEQASTRRSRCRGITGPPSRPG
jgi:hypothetical protein